MRSDNYFVVHGWMIKDLKLKGNALNVYAVIYGFSQDGQSAFSGSASYLAEFCGISRVSVFKILSDLVERGLIEKTECFHGKLKLCTYSVIREPELLPVKNVVTPGKECLPVGGKETLHNKEYNKELISNNNITPDNPRKIKHQYGEYKHVLLSTSQYYKLADEWGGCTEVSRMIKILDEGIETKGYKYKNHYLALKKWRLKEKEFSRRGYDKLTTDRSQGYQLPDVSELPAEMR